MATQGKAARSAPAKQTRWAKRIAQWAGSGQTQKAYCAKRGWAISTFQWWRARAKHAAAETAPVSFLPLTLATAPKEAAAVEVELSSKTRIRFEGALAERATERLLARIR